jgi:hypothetical protein
MNTQQLRELASSRDPGKTAACTCLAAQHAAWESITDDRWPAGLERVGSLRDPAIDEPTFEEFHPNGTRYGSPDAPIAIGWFPFNRCDVYRCSRCSTVFLRYTEYGGYYVDHRVRMVSPSLIVEL